MTPVAPAPAKPAEAGSAGPHSVPAPAATADAGCGDCGGPDAGVVAGDRVVGPDPAGPGPDEEGPAEARASFADRLQATLADELFAQDVYARAAEALGGRRFANLARAEGNHARALTAALRELGAEPVATHGRELPVIATAADVDRACIAIEEHVIEVYAGLIRDCPASMRPMLERIQEANRRHLAAFGGGKADPGNGAGPRGPGGGRGRGPGGGQGRGGRAEGDGR